MLMFRSDVFTRRPSSLRQRLPASEFAGHIAIRGPRPSRDPLSRTGPTLQSTHARPCASSDVHLVVCRAICGKSPGESGALPVRFRMAVDVQVICRDPHVIHECKSSFQIDTFRNSCDPVHFGGQCRNTPPKSFFHSSLGCWDQLRPATSVKPTDWCNQPESTKKEFYL
jgi:hypothetical protein